MRTTVLLLVACLLGTSAWAGREEFPPKRQLRIHPFAECPSRYVPPPPSMVERIEVTGISTAIAAAVISTALDRVGTALKKAGDEKSLSLDASGLRVNFLAADGSGVGLNPELRCLVAVSGHFDIHETKAFAESLRASWKDGRPHEDPEGAWMIPALMKVTQKLPLAALPDFYGEFVLAPSGASEFTVTPARLYFRRFSFDRWREGPRDYKFELVLRAAKADKPFATYQIEVPARPQGALVTHCRAPQSDPVERDCPDAQRGELWEMESLPLPLPAEGDDTAKAKAAIAKRLGPFREALKAAQDLEEAAAIAGDPRLVPVQGGIVDLDGTVAAALKTYCEKIPAEIAKKNVACAPGATKAAADLEAARTAALLRIEEDRAQRLIRTRCALAPTAPIDPDSIKQGCVAPEQDFVRPAAGTATVVSARLTETRPPNVVLQFFADVFTSAKPAIKTSLEEDLIPAKRRAAAEADEKDQRDARQAVALADANVKAAEAALAVKRAGTDSAAIAAAERDLVKVKIEANNAYRKAGLAAPYPDLD